MGGIDVSSFEEKGDRFDIRARYDSRYRNRLDNFGLIQLRSADGSLVDFHNVASVTIDSGPVQIDRYNRARKVSGRKCRRRSAERNL